jgi:hypothetical protein
MEKKVLVTPLKCRILGHDADQINTVDKTAVCKHCDMPLEVRFESFWDGKVVPVWRAKNDGSGF